MNYKKEKSKYEKRYEEQTRELLVLTGEDVGGAGRVAEGGLCGSGDRRNSGKRGLLKLACA